MKNLLEAKTLVVIGGTSGIGKEIACQAGALGANLIITGRDITKLKSVIDEFKQQSVNIESYLLDAHNEVELNGFFEKLPPIDHLVSMVGDVMGGGIIEPSIEVIRDVIESKFFTNLSIGRYAAKKIKDGGSIVFTSGSGGSPSTASASFIGNQSIKALVEGLAKELAPHIRVNTVAPGWMVTPFWREKDEDEVAATRKYMEGKIPMGRTGTAEEVAEAYIFMLQNTFITGQQLFVDGGGMLS